MIVKINKGIQFLLAHEIHYMYKPRISTACEQAPDWSYKVKKEMTSRASRIEHAKSCMERKNVFAC